MSFTVGFMGATAIGQMRHFLLVREWQLSTFEVCVEAYELANRLPPVLHCASTLACHACARKCNNVDHGC